VPRSRADRKIIQVIVDTDLGRLTERVNDLLQEMRSQALDVDITTIDGAWIAKVYIS
jgi:hypothetical protein